MGRAWNAAWRSPSAHWRQVSLGVFGNLRRCWSTATRMKTFSEMLTHRATLPVEARFPLEVYMQNASPLSIHLNDLEPGAADMVVMREALEAVKVVDTLHLYAEGFQRPRRVPDGLLDGDDDALGLWEALLDGDDPIGLWDPAGALPLAHARIKHVIFFAGHIQCAEDQRIAEAAEAVLANQQPASVSIVCTLHYCRDILLPFIKSWTPSFRLCAGATTPKPPPLRHGRPQNWRRQTRSGDIPPPPHGALRPK